MKKIQIIDSTIRDGNHTVGNNFSLDDISTMVGAMDEAGIDFIEVGYGYGLGSYKDKNKPSDIEIIKTAKKAAKNSKIAILVFPNKATLEESEEACVEGVDLIRIAVQATNAEPSREYIEMAKKHGIEVGAFFMMSHRATEEILLEEAKKAVEYGAISITVTDSAGAMTPSEVRNKISVLKENLNIKVGFHSHDNMGIAVGNSIVAIGAGASFVDTALCGLGAGSGNTKTEFLAAVVEKEGYEIKGDVFKILDACEILTPIVNKHGVTVENSEDVLMLGYAGTYSSFMKPARIAAEKYGADYKSILLEASKQKLVAGDEEQLDEIAKNL